jgi:hypothetical protein
MIHLRNESGLCSTTGTGKVRNDDRADWREAWALFPGNVAYVWCASLRSHVPHRRSRCPEGPHRGRCLGLGPSLESWLVDHVVLDGGPGDAACWAGLDALLSRTRQSASGKTMRILTLAIDTGFEAPAVYAWARRSGSSQVAPIKGVESFNRASPSLARPMSTRLPAASASAAAQNSGRWPAPPSRPNYRFLRMPRPSDEELDAGAKHPAGTIHLSNWINSEWCKQFVGEQFVMVRTNEQVAPIADTWERHVTS